jgi:hypothetical protein
VPCPQSVDNGGDVGWIFIEHGISS